MFNLLVESTRQSRRRTPKYFLLTFLAYGSVMSAAGIGSIVFYSPALADTYDTIAMIAPQPPQPAGGGDNRPKPSKQAVQKYVSDSAPLTEKNHIIQTQTNLPPAVNIPSDNGFNSGLVFGPGVGPGTGPIVGFPSTSNPGPAPEPVKLSPPPERRPDAEKPNNRIYKVSDGVTLGKAINIPRPVYPILAKQTHLEGEVRVELVVDKNGHVLSAVAVSGPPMLRPAAVDAALRSTFKPTLLSGEPVIVQAIFTFNFKLN